MERLSSLGSHPYLRVAISIGSGVCCALVLILWAISISRPTTITNSVIDPRSAPDTYQVTSISSFKGMLGFVRYSAATPLDEGESITTPKDSLHKALFSWRSWQDGFEVDASHLFIAVVLGVICALPWASQIRWSTRTIVFSAALFTVVLGLVIYEARS